MTIIKIRCLIHHHLLIQVDESESEPDAGTVCKDSGESSTAEVSDERRQTV